MELMVPVEGEEADNSSLRADGFAGGPPRIDEQDEENDVENTEGLPDPCQQFSASPMPQDDAAVGDLQQDAIGDEVAVPDRVAGNGGIHQGEHEK